MILEIEDVTGKVSWGHLAVPPGLTMGQMLDQHTKLKEFSRFVECATVNGIPDPRWRDLEPSGGQRVRLYVKPGGPILGILSAISFLVSVVSFFISLFNQPKQRRPETASPTYTFQGIADVLAPGDPVPVVYGRHRKGGQVLMYYVDVDQSETGQNMSLLLGMCEGEIDAIESASVLVNGVAVGDITSITIDMRMGLSSQSIIPGFEQVKNTFFDGRPIPPGSEGSPPGHTTSHYLIYRSAGEGDRIFGMDVQLLWPEGLWSTKTTGGKGKIISNWQIYEVAWTTAEPASHKSEATWASATTQNRIAKKTQNPFFQVVTIGNSGSAMGGAGQHVYVRVRHVQADDINGGAAQIVLQNVTEYGSTCGPFSGIALLSMRAGATADLNGGRPNSTAIVRGRKVRQYTSLTSFDTAWTQNPAWNVLDYMTNSIYGMGPWVTYGDADIQSFIDFATLSDSQIANCDGE